MSLRRIVQYLPLFFFSAVIFWFSHQPQPPIPNLGFQQQDKFYHFTAYFLYGFAVALAVADLFPRLKRGALFLMIVAFVMIYGASDEFHQSFVPGRSVELADWMADSAGGISAVVVIIIADKKKRRDNSKNLKS